MVYTGSVQLCHRLANLHCVGVPEEELQQACNEVIQWAYSVDPGLVFDHVNINRAQKDGGTAALLMVTETIPVGEGWPEWAQACTTMMAHVVCANHGQLLAMDFREMRPLHQLPMRGLDDEDGDWDDLTIALE